MQRSQYQGYRHNYRTLRREARAAGKPSGFSASVDLFLATFTPRERAALTAEKARAEAAECRKASASAVGGGYSGGRAYAVGMQIKRDCDHRALMLDKLAAELDARSAA